MLCCTLLAISSRFFALPGPGGPSRSHYVHSQLWKHCEVLIQRILLGQESYSNADSRVLGAIESLMLISDWPPRSIHLPPDNPDWDGQVMFPERTRREFKRRKLNAPSIRWQEDVFEPVKQVGQMSGRLLGVAVNLAYETGIFPDKPLVSFVPETRHLARFHRTRNLLCVYVNQMASRLGCSSPLPQNMSFGSISVPQQNEPGGQLSDSWTALWMDLTKLINSATVTFSPSHSAMKEVLAGYNLLNLNWTPSLAHWHDRFSSQLSGQFSSVVSIAHRVIYQDLSCSYYYSKQECPLNWATCSLLNSTISKHASVPFPFKQSSKEYSHKALLNPIVPTNISIGLPCFQRTENSLTRRYLPAARSLTLPRRCI